MKLKKKRKDLSKRRQELAEQVRLWQGRLLKEQTGWRAGTPGAAERIVYCQVELDKVQKEFKTLWTPQRAWASHGFLGR